MVREQVGYSLSTGVRRMVEAIAVVRRVPKSKVVEDALVSAERDLTLDERIAVDAVKGTQRR